MSRRTALILLGHGSHLNADSSAPVYAHAARIRAAGRFDEVLEAFWKEEPSLRDALSLVDADDVVVVPLFLAEGYFTREVLPRELGISGALSVRGSQRIHYCPPAGTHPAMAGMIVSRAAEVFGNDADRRARAALVIIGHGTERSETSGDTVYALRDRIRGSGAFGIVECGFLDESPGIGDVLAGVDAEDVVLVPFFVAEGWHTRETIPADLGLAGDVTRRGAQTIWYTPPVGTLPGMAEVVMEIAGETLGEGGRGSGEEGDAGRARPVRLAREAFFAWLDAAPGDGRTFLQLRIERETPPRHSPESGSPGRLEGNQEARYSLRPIPAAHRRPERSGGSALRGAEGRTGVAALRHPGESRDPGLLETDPAGALDPGVHGGDDSDGALDPGFRRGDDEEMALDPGFRRDDDEEMALDPGFRRGDDEEMALDPGVRRGDDEVGLDPGLHRGDEEVALDSRFRGDDERSLRARAVDIARYTDTGAYRPLRTAPDLRGGWSFTGLTSDELWEAVSVIYPGAVLDWHLYPQGALGVVDYRPWAARQTAMYEVVRDLTDGQVAEVVRSTCGPCLRRRIWKIGAEPDGAGDQTSIIVPCREPCTVFATEARRAAQSRVGSG